MSADLVVGEVGFGPTFATNPVDNEIIATLRAENRELTRQRNRLMEKLAAAALAAGEISQTLTAELSSNFPPENA